ncbi:MAG: hypothetical protein ACTSYM_05770 [Candidatus Baldrarchaeia archaeon]
MVYFDERTGKIVKNIPYKRYLQGKRAYKKKLQKEGIRQISKALIGLTPLGHLLTIKEILDGAKKIMKAKRR